MNARRPELLTLPLALLASCSATHLVYVHETTVGIDVGASANAGSTGFSFGYDSRTFAIVPRATNPAAPQGASQDPAASSGPDAMSLVAASQTYVEGVSRIEITHALATGYPAIRIARNANQVQSIVEATLTDKTAVSAQKRLDGETR